MKGVGRVSGMKAVFQDSRNTSCFNYLHKCCMINFRYKRCCVSLSIGMENYTGSMLGVRRIFLVFLELY